MTIILMIADASPSAVPFWSQTSEAVIQALAILKNETVLGVYLLGTDFSIPANGWHTGQSIPAAASSSCSFLSPVFHAVYARRERPDAILLFGSGEVFDLPDWAILESGARWLLIRSGPDSLSGAVTHMEECTPDGLGAQIEDLSSAKRLSTPGLHSSGLSGFIKHTWGLDRTRYPMIYVEPLSCYWSLFPTIKPQFESYLAQARPVGYDDRWYSDYLADHSPRLSPCSSNLAGYEALFATAMLTAEVERYAAWHGSEYHLPGVGEWQAAWRWLETQDISTPPAEIERHMAPTARCLWEGLLRQLQPKNLLELSLMRGGVLEWVRSPDDSLGGTGRPRHSHPFHDPFRDAPLLPTSQDRRSKQFGFRLVRSS